MSTPRVHWPGYWQLVRPQDSLFLLKISTTIKSLKGWLRYLLRQEFYDNQDNNNEGEHVDESPGVREAGND
jgi:hypothetical protein